MRALPMSAFTVTWGKLSDKWLLILNLPLEPNGSDHNVNVENKRMAAPRRERRMLRNKRLSYAC